MSRHCTVALCRQVRTKAASESAAAQQVAPVVEVCNVPELADECQNGAPVIHLIRSPAIHPVKEAAHLQEEVSQLPAGMTLEVRLPPPITACKTCLDATLHLHHLHHPSHLPRRPALLHT